MQKNYNNTYNYESVIHNAPNMQVPRVKIFIYFLNFIHFCLIWGKNNKLDCNTKNTKINTDIKRRLMIVNQIMDLN